MQVLSVQYGLQNRVADPQLTSDRAATLKFLSLDNACSIFLWSIATCLASPALASSMSSSIFSYCWTSRMQRKTFLLFVRWATLLSKSIWACSGPWHEVFSDHPYVTISRTLCKMLCAFSKFHSLALPTLSGKCLLRASSRPLLKMCSSCKSLTERFHSLFNIFHSKDLTRTSAISLLGSSTSGSLYKAEVLGAARILLLISATCARGEINSIGNKIYRYNNYLWSYAVTHSQR